MKKILIIDSHKGEIHNGVTSLHVRNAMVLRDALGTELIPSNNYYNSVAYKPWDVIIFNSSSSYQEIDCEILDNKKDTKLFYMVNDYLFGEPVPLWKIINRHNLQFEVIANHEQASHAKLSKSKWVSKWNVVNLNALIYKEFAVKSEDSLGGMFDIEDKKRGVIYFGAFRKDRVNDYKKYFDSRMVVSTSKKNLNNYLPFTNGCVFIDKLQWYPTAKLGKFKASLYIEDEHIHTNYNHLANRFYESIGCNVPVIFDESCRKTIELSGYDVPESLICKDADDLHEKVESAFIPDSWKVKAQKEKEATLDKIKEIVYDSN
jgi:hypothetical protein